MKKKISIALGRIKSTKEVRPHRSREITRSKRLWFTVVACILPFILLAIVELMLRQIEYAGNLDLVIKKRIAGKEFYTINRSVAQRYFWQSGTVVPEPAEDLFEIRKSKRTKRIFCLGESTMAGFPYDFHATAPGFLRDRLQTLLPQYNIEVINVGLSAVGSFIVRDFIQELIPFEPDLFIVYVGHNEFYGAYGVGSRVAGRGGPWLTQLTLSLLRFKTFLLLRDVYGWALKHFFSDSPQQEGTLMGEMAADQEIRFNSPLYKEARDIFRDNLSSIITTAKSHQIPIIFGALVSNIKDRPPFVSLSDLMISEGERERWKRVVASGDSALKNRAIERAEIYYRTATEIDLSNPSAYHKLGQVLYQLGKFEEAKHDFIWAKDRDALRFRATEDFHHDLIDICQANEVPVARLDSAFETASTHRIMGNELILEHLHPTVDGYFLMGETFFQVIAKNNLLVPAQEWNWSLDKDDDGYWQMSTVSEFDRLAGRIKIELLIHRWPFPTEEANYTFTPSNRFEEIVYRYVQGRVVWSEARYEAAEEYARQRKFDRARTECLAVSKAIPFSYQPLLRVADYFRMEGNTKEAKDAYVRCIQTEDNPFARMKLAVIFLEEERARDAAVQIETSFRLDAETAYKLSPEASALGRYLLGVAYAKQGDVKRARQSAEWALAIDPRLAQARELLDQLRSMKP